VSADHKRSLLRRWRTWVGGTAGVCLLGCVYALLPYFGIGQGITEANGRRIVAGMTRPEVEAVLGTPNPLPDLGRKSESFWDDNTLLGSRYVGIHVKYDPAGQVVNARVNSFWRRPLWLSR
jgi:hypothetical protein